MIVATDVTGIILVFNSAAEQMLGYRADEVIGRAAPWLVHATHEMRLVVGELAAESNERVMSLAGLAQSGRTLEWVLQRKDGTHVPVMLSVTALHDSAGVLTGFVGVATDVSSMKQVEDNSAAQRGNAAGCQLGTGADLADPRRVLGEHEP